MTGTIGEGFVVIWAHVRGSDLKSFPGERVIGLNREVTVRGDEGGPRQRELCVQGPCGTSSRESVFREVKGACVT